MLNKITSLAIISLCLTAISCSSDITTNDIEIKVDDVITESAIVDIDKGLINADLRDKIVGTWSTNTQPGQIDLNEDGSYKNCVFTNTASNDNTDECYIGQWSVEDHELVVISEFGDTVSNKVHWVFDNVIYLGHDTEEVGQELGWEYGMTKL
jgi:hypothetical protein